MMEHDWDTDFHNGTDVFSDNSWAEGASGDDSSTSYNVDLVLVIDGTGSMSHLIETVKSNALSLHEDLLERMKVKGKHIDQLRAAVVVFRDLYFDSKETALQKSDFFLLPAEKDGFSEFTTGIVATGGGPTTESGLEAVATAMQVDWTGSGRKRRHVTVVWTDADAYPLEHRADDKPAHYPSGLPHNFDELTDVWQEQDAASKRLLLFVPKSDPWKIMDDHWDNTVVYYSPAGEGLEDQEYSAILDAVSRSI